MAEVENDKIVFLLEEPLQNRSLYWTWKEDDEYVELVRKEHPFYKGFSQSIFTSIIELTVKGEINGCPIKEKYFKDWLRFDKVSGGYIKKMGH